MNDASASLGLSLSTPDMPLSGSAQMSARFQAALGGTASTERADPGGAVHAANPGQGPRTPQGPGAPVLPPTGAEQAGTDTNSEANATPGKAWLAWTTTPPGPDISAGQQGAKGEPGTVPSGAKAGQQAAPPVRDLASGQMAKAEPGTGAPLPSGAAKPSANGRVQVAIPAPAASARLEGGMPGVIDVAVPVRSESPGQDTRQAGQTAQPGGGTDQTEPRKGGNTPTVSAAKAAATIHATTASRLSPPSLAAALPPVAQASPAAPQAVGQPAPMPAPGEDGPLQGGGIALPQTLTASAGTGVTTHPPAAGLAPTSEPANPPARATGAMPIGAQPMTAPPHAAAAQTVPQTAPPAETVPQPDAVMSQSSSPAAPTLPLAFLSPAAPRQSLAVANPPGAEGGLPTPGPAVPPQTALQAQAAGTVAASAAMPASAQASVMSAVRMAAAHAAAPPASSVTLQAAPAAAASIAAPLASHSAHGGPNGLAHATPLLPAGALALSPVLRRTKPENPYRRREEPAKPTLTRQTTAFHYAPSRVIAYTDKRGIPLDLAPAALRASCWRIDHTAALVTADRDEHAASRRAIALHAALFDGASLAALGIGEGLSTWEGSPLWLRLAGIPKPAALGILPAEAAPAWIEIMRAGETEFTVVLGRGDGLAPRMTRHEAGLDFQKTLSRDLVYGSPADPAGLAALRDAGHQAAPRSWRAQEAWAAILRAKARETSRRVAGRPASASETAETRLSDLLLAKTRLPPDSGHASREEFLEAAITADESGFARLVIPYAAGVLARLSDGDLEKFDALDGLALALVIGRFARPGLLGAIA